MPLHVRLGQIPAHERGGQAAPAPGPRRIPAVGWSFIRRRRRLSTARMMIDEETTRTKSSTFSATHFGRGGRRIAMASSLSTSVRRFLTRRGRPYGPRYGAGSCICAAIRRSRICRVCSIRSFGAGSSITGASIARRFIHLCINWIDRWPAGPTGNIRSCAVTYGGQHTGWRAFRVAIRSCLRTGR